MRSTQGKYFSFLLVAIFVFCFACPLSCTDQGPQNMTPKEDAFKPGDQVHIVFPLPGDDFATMDDLAVLNQIKARIVDKKLGDVVSTGAGIGKMEIVLKVGSENFLVPMQKIISEVAPESSFSIEKGERPS